MLAQIIEHQQRGGGGPNLFGWGVADVAIAIVVIAAIVALVYLALTKFGVSIPEWVQHVFWIVVIALVIILAIKFVASL